MEDKHFDDIIKNKLDQARSTENSDWQDFESLLDEAGPLSDADMFDREIKQQVEEAKDAFEPSHWHILKARLEAQEFVRTRLYLAKGLELSILVLFYIGFNALYHPIDEIRHRIAPPVLMAEHIAPPAAAHPAEAIAVSPEALPSAPMHQSPRLTTNTHQATPRKTPPASTASSRPQLAQSQPAHALPARQPASMASTPALPINQPALADVARLPHRASLDIASRAKITPAAIALPDKRPADGDLLLGASIAVNADIIDSPSDQVYPNLLSYRDYSRGYSAGLNIYKNLGRLIVGTGVKYTHQAYTARPVTEVALDGAEVEKEVKLGDIAYDVISVPLSLGYRFWDTDRWSLYGMASLGVNVVTYSQYTIEESLENRSSRSYNIKSASQLDSDLELSAKPFSRGLLDGGSVFDNLYLSTALAVGAEHQITQDWSLDIGIGYRHHLNSTRVGPNQDRIHAFSTQIGVKRRI